MEEKSFFTVILERIRSLIRSLLRQLFPEQMHGQLGLVDDPGTETDGSAAGKRSESSQTQEEPDEEEIRRMKETPLERRHIIFYGRVQGVGFRYHAMYGARNFGLTGWVSNLPDGTVEMEIQGPSAQIDYLISTLGSGNWIRIEAMESEKIPIAEGERGFQVRGY